MLLLAVGLAGLLGFGKSQPCECTGKNDGLPEESRHKNTDFGTFCKAWDEKYGDCVKEDPEQWCKDKWCYVREGCTVDGEVTSVKSTYKDADLWFSYEVCGNPNSFKEDDFKYEWEDCEERDYPLDVYFAIDASGSIDEQEWENMQGFMKKLLAEGFQHPDDKVGITTWSRTFHLRFDFSSSIESIVETIGSVMEQNAGPTHTDQAILKTLEAYKAEPNKNTHEGTKRYLILITDGEPDDGFDPCTDGNKDTIKDMLDELDMEVGVLAIDGINPKNFNVLDCLVDEGRELQQIVVMNNFYSFYEYRDPTEGDICVDPNLFNDETMAPTRMPTNMPTECVMTDDSEEEEENDMCSKMKKNKCRKDAKCDYLEDQKKCMSKNSSNICAGLKYEAACDDHKKCKWDGRMCNVVKPVPRGKDWLGTQGPLFWKTCATNYCNKHTWEGGIDRCHYEAAKDGCGCMGLELDECARDNDCMVKNCQCEEKPKCSSMTFKQCKASDRCDVCNSDAGGCARKCSMAPGETLEDNQRLVLDQSDCKCKIHNIYPSGVQE